jgi:type I restriction-modification system DNA methylase subunit
LRKLNGIPQRVEGPLTESFHQQLLNQLYGVDINQFPAHLSVINLAIQNPKTRIQKIHVLPKDFFDLKPGQAVLTGFAGLTAEGGRTSVILPPAFEAVVANPPFIRQEYVGARASTLDDAAESSSSNALAL